MSEPWHIVQLRMHTAQMVHILWEKMMLQLPYPTHQVYVWTLTTGKGHSHRWSYTQMTRRLWGFHVSLHEDAEETGCAEKSPYQLHLHWLPFATSEYLWVKAVSFPGLDSFQLKGRYLKVHHLVQSCIWRRTGLREDYLLSSVPLVLWHFRFAQAGHLEKLTPQHSQSETNFG